MRALKLILASIIWLLCVAGIYFDCDERLWRGLRAAGLGGHAIGLLFLPLPYLLLLVEWAAAICLPIYLVWTFSKSARQRFN